MRAARTPVLAAFLATLASGPALAQVSVAFVQPERYTDAANRFGSGPTLRVTLAEMRRIFEELGRQYLPPGLSLAVKVLDIDLAGYEQPNVGVPYGLRVVSDVGPPRFRLHYVLRDGRRTLLSSEETLSDINFLLHHQRGVSNSTFGYERELLRDWFRSRIARASAPAPR